MIITIIIFIAILGLLVLVHELGHFIMARRTGMAVEEFGFGFPPRVFGFQIFNKKQHLKKSRHEDVSIDIADIKLDDGREVIREKVVDHIEEIDEISQKKRWNFFFRNGNKSKSHSTIYSINAFPIGGFVKIKGEQGDHAKENDSFASKPIWKRAIVLSSGVTMNFILAFVLISIGFMIGLPTMLDAELPTHANIRDQHVQISQVEDNSPAAAAKIQSGDIIISVNSQPVSAITDFQNIIKSHADSAVSLTIKRGEEEIQTTVTPTDLDKTGTARIGTWLMSTGLVRYPFFTSIWMGAKTTVLVTWQICVGLFELLKNLIVSHQVSADVAGPVGIAVLTGQVTKMGFIYILQFTALLSINLAIINFIPFPALDGGRVLFLIIEKFRGRPVNQRIEALVHNVGFLILIGLVAIVTFRDIAKLGSGLKGFLGNF
jgi:regulator of sigma E protease